MPSLCECGNSKKETAKHCMRCHLTKYNSGSNNSRYIDGRSGRDLCECGATKGKNAETCRACFYKYRNRGEQSLCECGEPKTKVSKRCKECVVRTGKANPSYVDNRTSYPEHRNWLNMLGRCGYGKGDAHINYITVEVCDRWLDECTDGRGFWNFLEDMGPKPQRRGYEVDRKDPDGHYEPGNCQWLEKNAHKRKTQDDRRDRLMVAR